MCTKKMISLILCIIFIISSTGVINVFASSDEYYILNRNYARILGRGETVGDSRCFNWPNARFEFSGSKAEVYVSEAKSDGNSYNGSFFNVA